MANLLETKHARSMTTIPYDEPYFSVPYAGLNPYDVVLPLFSANEFGQPKSQIGSCFSISRIGLYMTAAHIYRPFQDLIAEYKKPAILRQRSLRWHMNDLRTAVLRSERQNKEIKPIYDPVEAVFIFMTTDIALIFATPRGDGPHFLPAAFLGDGMAQGMAVSHLGYPGIENKIEWTENAISCDITLVETQGLLGNLYPEGRDHGHAWFPCVQSSANIAPGHSGGPVLFQRKPVVIGVNSISDGESGSILAPIGYILDSPITTDITIKPAGEAPFSLKDMTIRDLAQKNLVGIIPEKYA